MPSSPTDTDSLLTVAEAAKLLTVNPRTIRHWIAARRIGIVKVGPRHVRIRRSELERMCTEIPASNRRGRS